MTPAEGRISHHILVAEEAGEDDEKLDLDLFLACVSRTLRFCSEKQQWRKCDQRIYAERPPTNSISKNYLFRRTNSERYSQ